MADLFRSVNSGFPVNDKAAFQRFGDCLFATEVSPMTLRFPRKNPAALHGVNFPLERASGGALYGRRRRFALAASPMDGSLSPSPCGADAIQP